MDQQESLTFETVSMAQPDGPLKILDQTLLPGESRTIELGRIEDVWAAINQLQVRGAPAIGVTAAFGLFLAIRDLEPGSIDDFEQRFLAAKTYLASSRPTAVNLFWALDRMDSCLRQNLQCDIARIKQALYHEARQIQLEDIWVCDQIAEHGVQLIKAGMGILTHCNAGKLATAGKGTALAPVYLAHERGLKPIVYADETRPLLQGARLTAYELSQAGIDTTLICDNMASVVMKKGWVQAVFVGCDCVAANGDAANKIGTAGVSILAKYYQIPFYVCAPTSTIDMTCINGGQINIEQRNPDEVTTAWYYQRMAPDKIQVYNPAFDVTDAENITAIITEFGVATPPFTESLRLIFQLKEQLLRP